MFDEKILGRSSTVLPIRLETVAIILAETMTIRKALKKDTEMRTLNVILESGSRKNYSLYYKALSTFDVHKRLSPVLGIFILSIILLELLFVQIKQQKEFICITFFFKLIIFSEVF